MLEHLVLRAALATDHEFVARYALAVRDGDLSTLISLVRQPTCPADLVATLSRHPDARVRVSYLMRADVTDAQWREFIAGEDDEFAASAVDTAKTSQAQLELLKARRTSPGVSAIVTDRIARAVLAGRLEDKVLLDLPAGKLLQGAATSHMDLIPLLLENFAQVAGCDAQMWQQMMGLTADLDPVLTLGELLEQARALTTDPAADLPAPAPAA